MKSPLLAASLFLAASFNSAEEPKAELNPLYNGKDLTGWTTKGNWVPQEDGVLAILPREGETGWKRYDAYLTTEKQYGDFVFQFDYKHEKGGNSGFYFLISDPADPVGQGIEIQILDSHGKDPEKMTAHDCGGVIKTAAPKVNAAKPAGEWNTMKVHLEKGQLKAWLNGKLIQDLDLSEHDATKGKGTDGKGYISFQDHGLDMWFRNIAIKELK